MGVRTSRAETQERNRAKVLVAARQEFAERGFRDAKVDAIAQRVGLTRGAVYSNFPGKRALYFAVLADLAEQAYPPVGDGGAFADAGPEGGAFALKSAAGLAENAYQRIFGALALAWVRPLTDEDWLGRDLLPELLADDLRRPYTRLLELDALLLGLAIERLRPPNPNPAEPPVRLVRQARALLTNLLGATGLAASAPGFLEPYDVVTAVERLATLPINDFWVPPASSPPVRPADEPWNPPPATDLVLGTQYRATEGVVAVLGLNRLDSVEQAARYGPTTVVLVTGAPQELAPLARLTLAQLT
ncbi:MAG: TetR/AcrR family transcriptional regulator, partial [Saccharothrix sp.]|nr:TetR/AcrR family transcriptional regulator [Saccharothrix sp.]